MLLLHWLHEGLSGHAGVVLGELTMLLRTAVAC
jgi:hypothetical protein